MLLDASETVYVEKYVDHPIKLFALRYDGFIKHKILDIIYQY